MATVTYTDNGEQKSVPMWATESQMEALLKHFKADGGADKVKKTSEELSKRILDLNEAVNNLKDSNEELGEDLEEIADDINDKFESVGLNFQTIVGGSFKLLGDTIDFVAGTALTVMGIAITAITAKFVQLGNNFTELSQSGLALSGGTAMTLARMNELGYSTGEASKAMLENSLVFVSMSRNAVPEAMRSFLDVTSAGLDLGLTLGQSRDLILDELSMRAGLLNLGNLDAMQTQRGIQRIAEVNRRQLVYSKALGVSTDAMRDFADQVIGNNQMLLANIIRLPDQARLELATGLTEFISGMRGMGGEAGGEIGAAVLEAASMGAVGFSEAAFGFITVLPQLSTNMQGVIEDFNSGVIGGHEAAMAFTNELGNLSDAEKNRVFLLARAGDEQAKMMAKAIQQFEISAKNMKDQNIELEDMQTGMNGFNAVIEQAKGAFSSLVNNFMAGFGEEIDDLTEFTKTLATSFNGLLFSLFGISTETGKTSNSVKEFGAYVAGKLQDGIKAFADFLLRSITFLKGYFAGLAGDSIGEKISSMFADVGTRIANAAGDALYAVFTSKPFLLLVGGAIVTAIGVGAAKGAIQGGVASAVGGGAAAAAGGGAGKGLGKTMYGMGRGMKGLAVGIRAFAGPMVIAGLAVLTAAIIGIGYALKLAAPGIEAFGKAIKSVFEGIAAVVESVGAAIANILEQVGKNKVAKITAEADAMVKTTEATTKAIQDLSHLDPANVKGLAEGILLLGDSMGSFSNQMTPGVIDSVRGFAAQLFGNESPVAAIMNMSENADPIKIMDLAKATMAVNAANAGETTLDNSLTTSSNTNITTVNNTGGGGGGAAVDNSAMTDLLEALVTQGAEQSTLLKTANRKLSGIETNIG